MFALDKASVDRATTAVRAVDERIVGMFRRCFDDTLERAVERQPDGTAFVVTGDIPAMWLRDSTTQLTPYLHFLAADPGLSDLVAAVSQRQLAYLLRDPYANAFNRECSGEGHAGDETRQDGWVWERKYELDSLCYPIQLAYDLWQITGRTDHLRPFAAVADVVLTVIETEQHHEESSEYRFQRFDAPPSDTLVREGRGPLTKPNGMSWSAFRPSDDSCELGFNVPGNAFAAVALHYVAVIASEVLDDQARAVRAAALSRQIDKAIRAQAVVFTPDVGDHLAYEIDGFGNVLCMDDANVPSLLSLPFLGWCSTSDELYRNTRAFALSPANPYFHRGTVACGIGSPHTPEGTIWPIALAVQGLTEEDPAEKLRLLHLVADTDAGTGLVHESFHKDDARSFTRPWFSWANAMFCELALDVAGLRTYRRAPLHAGVAS